jgi:hypothetical protein
MNSFHRTVLFELFGLTKDESFQKIYGELIQDEMQCDECYSINNYTQFIKYRFLQSLVGVEIIGESCLNIDGCTIVLCYPLRDETNGTINVDITYPIKLDRELMVCEYQNVFWDNPGFFVKDCPIIIVNLKDAEDQKWRIKGCVLDTTIEDGKVCYTIKVRNCNCIFTKLLNRPDFTAEVEILPKSSVDSFGIFKTGHERIANKFSI